MLLRRLTDMLPSLFTPMGMPFTAGLGRSLQHLDELLMVRGCPVV